MQLHGPEGQVFYANPAAVASLREPKGTDLRHFPPGTRCVVVMNGGKFLPTAETCDDVQRLLEHPSAP